MIHLLCDQGRLTLDDYDAGRNGTAPGDPPGDDVRKTMGKLPGSGNLLHSY